MDLHYLGLAEAAGLMAQGRLRSVELTEALLDRIDRHDPALGAYVTVTRERALSQAERADAELARGWSRGPLHGLPIAVKDVIDTDFAPTTVGMPIRAHHVPTANATVVDRLEAAGAVILGKLTTAEGIFIGQNPGLPLPRNPRDPAYWPGASSSGSGVATAAGLCLASLGTDTGGSIRVPAAIHGLTGIKPTWGRVSRAGVFALSPTLDHVGPMARSAADAALLLSVIAGLDRADPTSLAAPVPDFRAALATSLGGVRIGVDEAYVSERVDAQVQAAFGTAMDQLERLGARIVPLPMPSPKRVLEGWSLICGPETALAHRGYYPQNAASYGPELSGLIDLGLATSAMDMAAALEDRLNFCGEMALLFDQVDMLAMPTLPVCAPLASDFLALLEDDSVALGRYTIPPNVTGHPAISLPCGMDRNGHPIGLQLVGRHCDEQSLFDAAHAFQSVTDWHVRHPELED